MKTDTLSKYFKKLADSIHHILKKPLRKYDEKVYHRLRVEIKKLNALFDLIQFCIKNFKHAKYFKPFKKIFKQSGKIREFQLEESMLKDYAAFSLENYLKEIKDHIKKEKNHFHFLFNKKNKKGIKKTLKKIAPFLKAIHKKNANNYIANERKTIECILLQKPLEPLQIHELRKRLKVDFYTRKSLNLQGGKDLKEEDDFQELLGKWHDSRTMNDHLEKSILRKEIDLTELKQLLKIHEEISFNSRKLLNEINAVLNTKTFNHHNILVEK